MNKNDSNPDAAKLEDQFGFKDGLGGKYKNKKKLSALDKLKALTDEELKRKV